MRLLDEELATLKRIVESDNACGTTDSPTTKPAPVGGVKRVKVQSGKNESFEALFSELQAKVRECEPGTVYYDLFRNRTDPQGYLVLEMRSTIRERSMRYGASSGRWGQCRATTALRLRERWRVVPGGRTLHSPAPAEPVEQDLREMESWWQSASSSFHSPSSTYSGPSSISR